jgi:hypothetical protein
MPRQCREVRGLHENPRQIGVIIEPSDDEPWEEVFLYFPKFIEGRWRWWVAAERQFNGGVHMIATPALVLYRWRLRSVE